MSSALTSTLGIIAGNGVFPVQVAEAAKAQGVKVVVVAHRNETDTRIEQIADHCTWIKVGQLGKIIRTFKREGALQATMAGGIRRFNLFGGIHLDWVGLRVVAKLRSVRDDTLLRGVAEEIERQGISVISASLILKDSIAREGLLTTRDLSAEEERDANLGWQLAKEMGRLDVGQTIVICQGLVVAVEAIEGTDAAILRAGELTQSHKIRGFRARNPQSNTPVVVKVCKPQQDQRLDLPTIGPETIKSMEKAGAKALVVEAGRTLMLEPAEVIARANALGIAIRAFPSQSA